MPHLGKKMNPAFARWVLHLDASDFPKFRPCLSPRITCSRFHTVDSVLYRTPYTADLYSYYTRPKRVCQSLDGVFRFFKKEKISRSKFKPYRLSSTSFAERRLAALVKSVPPCSVTASFWPRTACFAWWPRLTAATAF